MKIGSIILAAGKGKRMKSSLAKCLHQTSAKKALLEHVLDSTVELNLTKNIIVVGHEAEKVKACAKNWSDNNKNFQGQIKFALQVEQLGTGHATKIGVNEIFSNSKLEEYSEIEHVFIFCADIPLPSFELLNSLKEKHLTENSVFSIITFEDDASTSYGRIIRNSEGKITEIKEFKDCNANEIFIKEMNAGIYLANTNFLKESLPKLQSNNNQAEYYLTDLIKIALENNKNVTSVFCLNKEDVRGVNSLQDLQKVNRHLNSRRIQKHLEAGIQFLSPNPDTCFIDEEVVFEGTCFIGPNVQLLGHSKIEEGVRIDGNAYIENSTLGKNSHIKNFVQIDSSQIKENCQVGPFANIRPKTILECGVKVGNFVEVKSSHLHEEVKASHLSYLGDCEIGKNTNIGAGIVFANYDGKNKFKTSIGENCFIGSNSTLVAPIKIGSNSTVGAGSVIRESIEDNSLALTKGEFIKRKGWKRKK